MHRRFPERMMLAVEIVPGKRLTRSVGRSRFGSAADFSARPHAGPTRRRRGFTLVEVLVSLCIFAMAAVVLGASYLNVLNGYEVVSRGMQTNEDFAFARQLVLRESDRKKLEKGGDFETASGSRARW